MSSVSLDKTMRQRAWPLRGVGRLLVPALLLELCWLALWLALDTFVHNHWAFQLLFIVAFACYGAALLAARGLLGLSKRAQVAIVLGGTLLFHLTLLPAEFAFSDDIFRYVWDGRVNAAGIDPYRYAPGDEALAPLRDARIWEPVNAKEQPSPYPPLLESTFALVYRIWPESIGAMKVAMILLNMVVVGLLMKLLVHYGKRPLLAIIYAWNPQVVFQEGFSGHNEPLLMTCVLGALLFGSWGTLRGRMLGGWALALATLAKLVPLIMLPLIVRRWGWRAAGAYVATLVGVYGALFLRGQHLLSGASVEVGAARFNDGLYYLIDKLVTLTVPVDGQVLATRLVMAACLGAVMLWLLRQRSDDMTPAAGTLLATYVVLAASVAPWYALWILPFVALDALPRLPQDRRSATAMLLGGYWLLFSWTATFSELFYFKDQRTWMIMHTLEYVIPVASMAGLWWWSRRRSPLPLAGAG